MVVAYELDFTQCEMAASKSNHNAAQSSSVYQLKSSCSSLCQVNL
jgi:hypothetical protein